MGGNRVVSPSLGQVRRGDRASGRPGARADEYTKQTFLTFSGPVQVPGMTLPAGRYMFKLADPEGGRRAIQIWDEKGTKMFAMLLTIPDEQPEAKDDPVPYPNVLATVYKHLGINTDLNAGINGVRPNALFDKIIQDISGANSVYNSFIAGVDKRFSKGFSIGANYTWAKSLDWASNLSDLDTVNVVNPYNLRAEKALSGFDSRQRLIAVEGRWRRQRPF
jgi:hypothetical protein